MEHINLALFISGGASTARAIIQSCYHGRLSGLVTPALVIASHDKVAGIENIRQHESWKGGYEKVIVIDRYNYVSSFDFGDAILHECGRRKVNLIGQYGWMEKTPPNVVKEFSGRSINQHPAPLDPRHPQFGGPGVHGIRAHFMRLCFVRQVKRDFWTEATTHRVEDIFDDGEILGRSQLEILPTDTPQSLQERLLPLEHELQIDVLEQFARDKVKVFRRTKRLVRPGEEVILAEALRYARLAYPYKRIP